MAVRPKTKKKRSYRGDTESAKKKKKGFRNQNFFYPQIHTDEHGFNATNCISFVSESSVISVANGFAFYFCRIYALYCRMVRWPAA